jgi:protein-tyrosine phosphatase
MKNLLAMLSPLLIAHCAASPQPPAVDAGSGGDCRRRVLVDDVTNARDLGGWQVAAGVVGCQRVLRGGALTGLTAAGCAEFADLGVRTIIDLREQPVQDSTPPPACAGQAAQHVSAAMPKLLPDTPDNYLALLDQCQSIRQIFSLLSAGTSFAVYLHCEIGRDRASFVTALILLALGADRRTVLDEFALSSEAGVAVKTECMAAVLDEIERRGGIESFLSTCGVDAASLAALRDNAVAEP